MPDTKTSGSRVLFSGSPHSARRPAAQHRRTSRLEVGHSPALRSRGKQWGAVSTTALEKGSGHSIPSECTDEPMAPLVTHSLANSSVARDALTEKLRSCTASRHYQSIPVPEPHQAAMLSVMVIVIVSQRTAPDTDTAWSRGQVVRRIRPSVSSSCWYLASKDWTMSSRISQWT